MHLAAQPALLALGDGPIGRRGLIERANGPAQVLRLLPGEAPNPKASLLLFQRIDPGL